MEPAEQVKVKFIHLRETDGLLGELLPKGGTTIAYLVEANTLRYAIARCSPKDHYTKSVGRAVAQGRLLSAKGCKELFVPNTQWLVSTILKDFDNQK